MIKADTVIDIFSIQAKTQPANIALKFGEIELTYQQLDEISNQLAHHLIAKGITRETLVPICLYRPLDTVIAILGILKAGAAYVPIDPEFPAERIKYMLADTAAEVVISDSRSTLFLSAADGKTIISADNDWAEIKSYSTTPTGVKLSADSVAYVIYTSGSTGQPKGVLIEHRSIIDYLQGLFNRLPYETFKSFAVGVSFAADSVITNLFGSLILGAELHLFFKDDYNNVEYIHQYFKTHDIDCLKIVPSHWKSLALNGAELLPKKLLMFGGEALYTSMIKDIIPASARECILVNHYGPTEATVGQLLYEIKDNVNFGHTIPIGKPFTAATVHILNEDGSEVEDDAAGELYIGGTCVARGYLNRPELTAQRFIKDKFNTDENARLYRTGDLVRKLPDGNIEFLGRIDDQVKIRGYRIELGEIENILQKAPGVKQSVVLAQEGSNSDKRLVGYVVCPTHYDKRAISSYLQEKLPIYMVPQILVHLDELPFFPNGKLDKKALPNPDASTLLTNAYVAPVNKTETIIAEIWKELLAVERVGAEDNFFELGGNSLLAQKFIAILKSRQQLHLHVTKLYQYPKIKDIAAFLDGKTAVKRISRKHAKSVDGDIAVIGMSGRFPGADSIDELWDVLKNGKETTSFFEDHELDTNISPAIKNNPNYVKARGIITDVKGFDAVFFGINPKWAELMDPQQRIFLEIAWEAMEGAGYVPGKYEGTMGVFAGVRFNTYYANNVSPNDELIENVGRFQVLTLNDKDYVASRTAYALDLKGPAVNVQSACSTSLLAIVQAVQSIRNGQCDMALAGGATINAPVNIGHIYDEGAMLSNDGHCRPFDADAKGTVFSDGAGVVLLKNKEQALKDGDTIIAIIKGVGLSNDGGGKGSFTAPSAEGQAEAISMAIDDAGINAADISYIETHGTATPLGDPIEIEGLNIAFGEQKKKQYCAIGSVKSNFGHLTAASGVAGFIKAALALQHKQLPPSINFKTPNPHIDFANSPFFVNAELNNWELDKKRIAGVSSFGVGGTNVHLILQESERLPIQTNASRPAQLLCWSAKAEKSLNGYGDKLTDYLANNEINFADVAYTLQTAREDFNYKRFVVAIDADDFIEQSKNLTQFNLNTKVLKEKAKQIVFMFPGQGDQYLNMGKALYDTEKVFKQAMDECAEILKGELKENILNIIYPAIANETAEEKLKNTAYSQPALFSIGYALGKLWMSWGIFPAAFVGHSIGEFVSAYFAGVNSLSDALKLIAARGKMMSDLPQGSMLSVRLPYDDIQPYLSAEIALAAVNSPQLCVVAGTNEAINQLSIELTEKGILNRLLSTSHAFHSHLMEPVVAPFEAIVKSIKLSDPLIPIASSVTGEWLTKEEATNPAYWANHLRATVVFGKAVQKLIDENYNLFLELGPGKSVATLARQQAAGKPITAISSLEKNEEGQSAYQSILKALGQLWLNGIEPDWKAYYKDEVRQKRTDLPTYAFNKQNYWVEPIQKYAALQSALLVAEPVAQQISETIIPVNRKDAVISKIKEVLENASGIEMTGVAPTMSFIEIGLDSLLLTQIALMLKKQFALPITFRQLNEELGSLDLLSDYLEANTTTTENSSTPQIAKSVSNSVTELSSEEQAEIKKPFGAIARIEKQSAALSVTQQQYLAALIERYNQKTKGSKAYTQQHRPYMADPRVVSGFRPATKELVYSIVIKKSKGSRLWDIDGNEYIDALNGFGSNLLGYQPDVIKNAIAAQIEKGYEIGPQHELAGEVCKLICEFTNFDRSALCNTGSEAVIGAMRIARTVTGRSLIVAFTGSYHGITDEVIARGSKKLKTYPAAPGIMPEAVQNMLILEYGSDEALKIIAERAEEIAAVLVEPIQSRRADFQPVNFLKKLRRLTKQTKTVLIFDEVISGFRFHPGGVQAMFGIKADIGTYGKVVGGGMSIGIIAGEREYMDALDGGYWQYGDDSIPEVGVTYFAGTFVRHPLALAAAKASLNYLKEMGPQLQENLNANTLYIATTLSALCRQLKVPIFIAQFGSLWRIRFLEDYPYMELFFILMRYKGIHIQEGFPCFLTTAHSNSDIEKIITCFEESLIELKEAGLIPEYNHPPIDENKSINIPPVPNAKMGKDKEGNPAWFIKDEQNAGKYLQVTHSIQLV